MIVFDTSTLVGAAGHENGKPARAILHAMRHDTIALSEAVLDEIIDVLYRPKLARLVSVDLRAALIGSLASRAVFFVPAVRVADCRDAKDNKYLELALAADASMIVSSDSDLLMLDPWRGRRILTAATCLVGVRG